MGHKRWMKKGKPSLRIEKLELNGSAFMEMRTPCWCWSLSLQIPGIMVWRKLSHLESVPKSGCYFGLPLAERSLQFPQCWIECALGFLPFLHLLPVRRKEQDPEDNTIICGVSTQCQALNFTQFIAVVHPHGLQKDGIIPCYRLRTWRSRKIQGSLIGKGWRLNWAQIYMLHSHSHEEKGTGAFYLNSFLDSDWDEQDFLSTPQVCTSSRLWAYSFILW